MSDYGDSCVINQSIKTGLGARDRIHGQASHSKVLDTVATWLGSSVQGLLGTMLRVFVSHVQSPRPAPGEGATSSDAAVASGLTEEAAVVEVAAPADISAVAPPTPTRVPLTVRSGPSALVCMSAT